MPYGLAGLQEMRKQFKSIIDLWFERLSGIKIIV